MHARLGPRTELGQDLLHKCFARLVEGVVVDVEITDWPSATQSPRGRVTEILGREDDFGVDVEIIIRKFHLPHHFPAATLEEAQDVSATIPASELEESTFEDGLGFDGSSIRGWQAINESDMLVLPVPETAFIDPFCKDTTLTMICNIQDPLTK